MMTISRMFGVCAAGAVSMVALGAPPETAKKPVTNEYHGVKVVDEYQWLENWEDPAVRAWSDAQNEYARSVLDHLPNIEAIRARITDLSSSDTVRHTELHAAGGKLFVLKHQPPKQQPFIVVMESADRPETERVVVDPNVIDTKGLTAIDWYRPSADGKLLAVSMSQGGSEAGDVHVFDVATGKPVGSVVPRVNGGTAGGDLAWAADGSGFWYTRYPRGNERAAEDMDFYTQVYFHPLGGKTEEDRYEIGKDFPRIAEINLETSKDGKNVLATVQDGDGGEFSHFVRFPDGSWKQLTGFKDKVVHGSLGGNGDVYFVSRNGAPKGKIITMPLTGSLKDAVEIVPEAPDANIETLFSDKIGIVVTKNRLYLIDQVGGPNRVRVFNRLGMPELSPTVLPVSSVDHVVATDGDEVLIHNESMLEPAAWYRFNPKNGDLRKTALASTSPVSFADCEVVRETAVSKDGTKVPMTILMRKGTKLDGNNPTILWGYGGYGVSISPNFRAVRKVWLEQGGVFAVAHLRGGGEYGDQWHREGNLTKKQNVFDDFAACCRRLEEAGYTSPKKLAIMGGSNGGLLMGALMTQHPELFGVCVSHVGIYDMLRVELSPNGAFNVTEFGTVKDPEQFRALAAYSPYQHVTAGKDLPPILMLTGANDPRVDPMHSRKFTAALQAASSNPVLLRTSATSGHGIGSSLSERIEQDVDVYGFLFDQLGVNYTVPGGATPGAKPGR
ncbi:MAG: S9 family peptidase [Phycisphaeraceae bacterium]|nr:S9 family peptidase [Phycisphaeraceae bacterium]